MKFNTLDLHNKRILLRADLNVPLKDGSITDDFRLKASLPTIQDIQKRGGTLIIITHLGRPQGYDPLYSTSHLLPWFRSHGIPLSLATTYDEIQHHIDANSMVILFENVRFFSEEQSSSQHDREVFCKKIAHHSQIFVNDAFGALHRNDATITTLPLLFGETHRSLGPLVHHELHALNTLKQQVPLVCIVGGKKIGNKLSTCEGLFSIADSLIIGPALSFTLMKAQGLLAGKSLLDISQVTQAKKILEYAHTHSKLLYLPEDYAVTNESFPGNRLYVVDAHSFPKEATGITIGPKSIATIQRILHNARGIVYAGLIGSIETNNALSGTYKIFTAMAQSSAYTVIAGGDSVGAAQLLGISQNITHLSTGGGSSLAYLSGKTLPGLIPFRSELKYWT